MTASEGNNETDVGGKLRRRRTLLAKKGKAKFPKEGGDVCVHTLLRGVTPSPNTTDGGLISKSSTNSSAYLPMYVRLRRHVLCVGFGSALQNDRAPSPLFPQLSPGKATTEGKKELRHLEATYAYSDALPGMRGASRRPRCLKLGRPVALCSAHSSFQRIELLPWFTLKSRLPITTAPSAPCA